MQLSKDTDSADFNIKQYESHKIKINEIVYNKSLILTPHSLDFWTPQTFNELKIKHIETLLTYSPKIVLIGTGEEQLFPDMSLLAPLINQNIGIEVMSTRSACYTFKILTAEKRNALAALLL